jgi:4-methyl-5(b-hydroxyethyl)-thiazole monophosphate biosynthesis
MRADGRPAALAREFAARGNPVAAICAAPLVLMDAGLLRGRRFTAHASARQELWEHASGICVEERVVVDRSIITSRGAGTAVDFGLTMIRCLVDEVHAERIAKDIMA